MPSFRDRLTNAWQSTGSLLCVGLDPDPSRMPEAVRKMPDSIFAFNRAIIEATAPFTCAYKPQAACYHAVRAEGELESTCCYLKERHPDKIVILDAKRGDIGSTARFYASEAFARYEADAVTVNPYLGGDSLEPFLEDPARGVFLLCRTSNPGAADLQNLTVGVEGRPLYEQVAMLAIQRWNQRGNLGLVTGATWPVEIARLRQLAGSTMPFLVPGIGAQGGDLAAVLQAGLNTSATGLLINSSRGIIHASSGSDFAEAAAEAAAALHGSINRLRAKVVPGQP